MNIPALLVLLFKATCIHKINHCNYINSYDIVTLRIVHVHVRVSYAMQTNIIILLWGDYVTKLLLAISNSIALHIQPITIIQQTTVKRNRDGQI